jgi:excinuclease ABC subunit A
VVEDLSFLGDMEIVCPACNGKRFQEAVLSVTYQGKNLLEVLAMTAAEARSFFFDHRAIAECLDAVLKVGMGYVTLGQGTSSFSGGEAQRLKLVQIMRDARKGKPLILIFDEPTTGLSDVDVAALLAQFRELTAMGHTLIIVEHHLDVLSGVDWLIEIGPDASEHGGEVVFQGAPRDIAGAERSVTKKYLI